MQILQIVLIEAAQTAQAAIDGADGAETTLTAAVDAANEYVSDANDLVSAANAQVTAANDAMATPEAVDEELADEQATLTAATNLDNAIEAATDADIATAQGSTAALLAVEAAAINSKKILTNKELLSVGKKKIKNYLEKKEIFLHNEALLSIENLTKEFHETSELKKKYVITTLETIITQKVLNSLANAKISTLSEINELKDIGFNYIEIKINEEYNLYIYYLNFYKSVFEKMINKKKVFIGLVVKNCFNSYLNTIPSYIDVITKLPNINKLKKT